MKTSVLHLILLLTLAIVSLSCREEMPNTYSVQFIDIEGNSMGLIQMIEQGDTAFHPGSPGEVEGVDFAGWYTNDGQLYDFGAEVKQDLVIISVYLLQKRTVVFDHGYDNKRDSVEVFYGAAVERPQTNPERDYYTFEEWKQNGTVYNFLSNIFNTTVISATWSKDYGYGTKDEGIYLVKYYRDIPEVFAVPDSMYGQRIIALKDEKGYTNCIFDQSHSYPNTTTKVIDISKASFLKSINLTTFAYCTNLESIIFNEVINSIGSAAFRESSLETALVLPASLRSIGRSAFTDFQTPEILINQELESIDYFAFSSANGFSDIDIDCKVEFLSGFAFAYCRDLKKARLGKSIKIIDAKAFYSCDSLKTLILTREELPLTTLQSNDVAQTNPFAGSPVFEGTQESVIYYPAGSNYPNEVGWKDMKGQWIAVP